METIEKQLCLMNDILNQLYKANFKTTAYKVFYTEILNEVSTFFLPDLNVRVLQQNNEQLQFILDNGIEE